MKKIYISITLCLFALVTFAQVTYTYSISYLGTTGTGGNPEFALMLTADNNATSNSPTSDFGLTLRVPNDYTIGNYSDGDAGFQFFEYNIDSEVDQGDGTDFIQLQRTEVFTVSFTHPANQVYELIKFDLIAQNGAAQVPTSGEVIIEDIDMGANDTYFNIDISEDPAGTADYLAASNTSSFNFASLSTREVELNEVSIFPNPVKNTLNIKGLDTELSKIEVYNIAGQVVMTNTTNLQSVNVNALSNGVYFAKLYTEATSKTIKFIKE